MACLPGGCRRGDLALKSGERDGAFNPFPRFGTQAGVEREDVEAPSLRGEDVERGLMKRFLVGLGLGIVGLTACGDGGSTLGDVTSTGGALGHAGGPGNTSSGSASSPSAGSGAASSGTSTLKTGSGAAGGNGGGAPTTSADAGAGCPVAEPTGGASCNVVGQECDYYPVPGCGEEHIATCQVGGQWSIMTNNIACVHDAGGGTPPNKTQDAGTDAGFTGGCGAVQYVSPTVNVWNAKTGASICNPVIAVVDPADAGATTPVKLTTCTPVANLIFVGCPATPPDGGSLACTYQFPIDTVGTVYNPSTIQVSAPGFATQLVSNVNSGEAVCAVSPASQVNVFLSPNG